MSKLGRPPAGRSAGGCVEPQGLVAGRGSAGQRHMKQVSGPRLADPRDAPARGELQNVD
jgi:hypothetical protein